MKKEKEKEKEYRLSIHECNCSFEICINQNYALDESTQQMRQTLMSIRPLSYTYERDSISSRDTAKLRAKGALSFFESIIDSPPMIKLAQHVAKCDERNDLLAGNLAAQEKKTVKLSEKLDNLYDLFESTEKHMNALIDDIYTIIVDYLKSTK